MLNELNEKLTLKKVQENFETALKASLNSLAAPAVLHEALCYAMDGGGKRLRPVIVLLTAEGLATDLDVMKIAIAAEYLHTASLIIDDMPCMDNDEYRRGRYSLHKAYGETVALLTSTALITESFKKVHEATEVMKMADEPFCQNAEKAGLMAIELIAVRSGYQGAITGQYLDLYPTNRDLATLKKIIELKTVTLFETSFQLGWLFGGGDLAKVEEVGKLGYHFGMAFQIADDIRDYEQDVGREAVLNTAVFLGKDEAFALFEKEIALFKIKCDGLGLLTQNFKTVVSLIEKYARN